MAAHLSLIADLEEAVQAGTRERRIETLRQITDLFLGSGNRLNSEQIDVFDEVLGHLVKRVEASALSELSERLAPVDHAPIGVIRSLARDNEISVAGPVLMQSPRLSTDELIEIASTKSQAHLLAISGRRSLEDPLTDVLIERGNNEVCRKLAANSGAQFSDKGYGSLLRHAETDDILGETLGSRLDIPPHFLRQLIEKASQIVRDKLLAILPQQHKDQIKAVLAKIGVKATSALLAPPDFDYALSIVKRINEKGELNEHALIQFAKSGEYAQLIAGLSLMCYTPVDLLDKAFQSRESEAFLIPCKAANLSWTTTQSLLRSIPRCGRQGEADLAELRNDYSRLSATTAQRVLRFWQVQQAAGKDIMSTNLLRQ